MTYVLGGKKGFAAFRLKGNVYLYPFSFPPLKNAP